MKTSKWIALGVISLSLTMLPRTTALDFQLGPFGSYFDVDDAAGEAWGGGLMGRLEIVDWFAVDARASYLDFKDVDLNLVPLEAAVSLRLPLFEKRFIPYAGVGVGYYLYDEGRDFEDVDDNFGFFPMVGFELRFGSRNQWALFGEARWLFISSSISEVGDELENIDDADLDGLGVNVGILYRF